MMNQKGQLGLGNVIMAGIILMTAFILLSPIQEVGDSVLGTSNLTNNTVAHLLINLFPAFFLLMILWGLFAYAQPVVSGYMR